MNNLERFLLLKRQLLIFTKRNKIGSELTLRTNKNVHGLNHDGVLNNILLAAVYIIML